MENTHTSRATPAIQPDASAGRRMRHAGHNHSRRSQWQGQHYDTTHSQAPTWQKREVDDSNLHERLAGLKGHQQTH